MTGFTFLGLSNLNHLPKNISKKKIIMWIIFLELLIWFIFIKDMKVKGLIIYPICYMMLLLSSVTTLLDFYKNKRKSPTFAHYLLYASCFSKLLFGPALSYYEMEEEIKKRSINREQIINGCFQFLRGLFQNVLLIGMLSALKEELLAIPNSMLSAWILLITTMLQIVLFMMSYSNMSLGLSKMLGFHFKEETNYPLCLSKMKYFFASWHYSVASFWNKYLKDKFPFIVQMTFFMLLLSTCYGLNYVHALWFLFIGLGITIEELFLSKKKIDKKYLMIFHIILMVLSFTFLVDTNIIDTWKNLFVLPIWNTEIRYLLGAYSLVLIFSCCIVFKIGNKISHYLEKFTWYHIARMFFSLFGLWLTLMAFLSEISPFIWSFRI